MKGVSNICGSKRGCVRFLLLVLLGSVPFQVGGEDLKLESHIDFAVPDWDLPQIAQRGELVEDVGRLRFKAKDTGSVPLIVGLRMKSKSDSQLESPLQNVQQGRIAALQNRLLQELPGSQLTNVKRFRFTPHVAVSATPEGIDKLLQSSLVTYIEEDVALPPLLAQSTHLIGADRMVSAGVNGSGWAVAILDTGVQSNHPFLSGSVVHEACFSTNDAAMVSLCPNGGTEQIGMGAASPCSTSVGDCSHGTHVAGIAAGSGNPGSGVAPGASVIAIQVFAKLRGCTPSLQDSCLRAYVSDWVQALEHLYSIRSSYPIAAANLSLGGLRIYGFCDGYSDVRAAKQAIDNLKGAGIATVIASGNDGYIDSLSFPACISSAISVGSTWDTAGDANQYSAWNGGLTSIDEVAAYSNSSELLDLLAPGSRILSSIPGDVFINFDGTSMAAPHVAGCWALIKQVRPNASVDEIEFALMSTGVPVRDWRNQLTKPRLDCKAALDSMTTGAPATQSVDLQISSIGVTPATVAGGGQMRISASVRNAGSAISGGTILRYYRSNDATISPSDTLLTCSAQIGSLQASQFFSAPVCQINAPTVAGTYYYGVCVGAVSGETDTGNNCSVGQEVSVISTGSPDLIVSYVSGISWMSSEREIDATVHLENRGNAAAAASKLHVYLSYNDVISTDDIFVGSIDIPELAAGRWMSLQRDLTLPISLIPGKYHVGAIADATGLVAESNEQNNATVDSFTTEIRNSQTVASLSDAVDTLSMNWVTGGHVNWFRQTTTSYQGGDAARSGDVNDSQVSYLQTKVSGPGRLTFQWKVSSEQDYDVLAVMLDNQLIDYISGEADWREYSLSIPSGQHAVTWMYVKDDSVTRGQDSGWLDKVVFTAGGSSLLVSKSGPGKGEVTSSAAGIQCGVDCFETYGTGTAVTLTARPDYGYEFSGWTGDCSGHATCVVEMTTTRQVTAWFSAQEDAFPSSPLPQEWNLTPIDSNRPWSVSTSTAKGGVSSLRSGIIGNDQLSIVNYSGAFLDGNVEFSVKVSSEAEYDFFVFLIDDELMEFGSGEIDWTNVRYPISAGPHTLTWAYFKDDSISEGRDAAWIDSVNLPVLQNGLWIIDAENDGNPGRGFQIDSQNSTLAMTFYGYQPGGDPLWYLAVGPYNGKMFTGALETFANGMSFGGSRKSARSDGTKGNLQLNFATPTTGTLTLPGEAPKAISKMIWGSETGLPRDGLWIIDEENDGSPGRGFQLDAQDNVLALTFYGYEQSGEPVWYLAVGEFSGNEFQGSLDIYEDGMPIGGQHKSGRQVGNAGNVIVNFTTATSGSIQLPGEVSKRISKLIW